jgi:hypothetical protein
MLEMKGSSDKLVDWGVIKHRIAQRAKFGASP